MRKGYSFMMEGPSETHHGAKYGNENALRRKEYFTDDDDSDDDDNKCRGYCKPKIYINLSDWSNSTDIFNRVAKQYENNPNCGLFPTHHNRLL